MEWSDKGFLERFTPDQVGVMFGAATGAGFYAVASMLRKETSLCGPLASAAAVDAFLLGSALERIRRSHSHAPVPANSPRTDNPARPAVGSHSARILAKREMDSHRGMVRS